jgi:hypothetical protein
VKSEACKGAFAYNKTDGIVFLIEVRRLSQMYGMLTLASIATRFLFSTAVPEMLVGIS